MHRIDRKRNGATLPDNAVAIIGMAGRFPKSPDLQEFWRNLRSGRECISFFSPDELLAAGVSPELFQRSEYVPAGAVLEDADRFDASFFGLSGREAEILDPQQRVFLECSWHALEDAGYDPHRYDGAIGIYAGSSLSTYMFNLLANPETLRGADSLQIILGNDKDHLATRIAYKLNLRGPAISVQTACSTSLVAVCLACQSLLDHHSDMALAGGVRIKFPQTAGYLYEEGMISSPDGHCRPFDARARGTLGGNGAGVVLLKRLEDAVADGDSIRAVILASALNNDGSNKVGYSAPSVGGQAAVIAAAQALAGIDPQTISYVEAHGTATALGDPIEIAALRRAFQLKTARTQFCSIGSVKSNLGHLDAAAGIASLIKTVLMMNHGEICPSLHFERPNPEIDFAGSPFRVAARLEEWPSNGTPRRAGVSSFGMGGTNAHVILEEWRPETKPEPVQQGDHPLEILPISANTTAAFDQIKHGLAAHLQEHPGISLSDAAWTLQAGRKAMPRRGYVLSRSIAHARDAFTGSAGDLRTSRQRIAGESPNVVFLFPGQGSQYARMGRQLYKHHAIFRDALDRCAKILRGHLGLDIRDAMFTASPSRIDETEIAQPALFVMSYALAQFWQSCGIKPAALLGHSIGEFVAACVAGVMSLEDSLFLVAQRGRLMQEQPRGCMFSVAVSEQEVLAMIRENAGAESRELALAAVNAPTLCAVSGSFSAMEVFEAELIRRGVPFTHLHTSHAFHSPMTDPVLAPFAAIVRRISLRQARIPYISNLTGDWITHADSVDPMYWTRHLRQTVRFADGVAKLLELSNVVLLEAGPADTLCSLARGQCAARSVPVIPSMRRRLNPGEDDCSMILQAAGDLWLSGALLDWHALGEGRKRGRIALPLYPFERQRYWIDPPQPAAPIAQAAPAAAGPAREPFQNWFYRTVWQMAPLDAGASETSAENWLIFVEPGEAIDAILDELRPHARSVAIVRQGAGFGRLTDSEYEIDARNPADYEVLIDELCASGHAPGRILHAWNLPPRRRDTDAGYTSIAEFEKAQEIGFHSLVSLGRALSRISPGRAVLNVLASELQLVLPDDLVDPARATLLGPCRVMPQELSAIRCRVIDAGGEKCATAIAAELQSPVLEPTVAFRGGTRFVPRFERIAPESPHSARAAIAPRSTWLISGGLGHIGLAIAETLIRTAQATVILLSHTGLPHRAEWPRILAQNAHEMQRRIRGVQALEAFGHPVEIAVADLRDEDQVRTAIAQARGRFGDIAGVIHCAADTAPDAFVETLQTSPESAARHFRPKVHGLLALEKVLAEEQATPPSVTVLMSSLASVLGGLGFCAYAAANAFLDAWADAAGERVPRRISINWDGWNFGSANSQDAMTPLEGVHAFLRVLRDESARRISIATTDLETRHRQWVAFDQVIPEAARKPAAPQQHPRPELSSNYVAPRDEIEALLAGLWEEVFALDQIGVEDNFFELGGHSLLGIQLASRIRDALGLGVSVGTVLDSPTIASLRSKLDPELAELSRELEAVEALSSAEARAQLNGADAEYRAAV